MPHFPDSDGGLPEHLSGKLDTDPGIQLSAIGVLFSEEDKERGVNIVTEKLAREMPEKAVRDALNKA